MVNGVGSLISGRESNKEEEFEAGSYLRLIDFVYQSTLDLSVIKKQRNLSFEVPDLENDLFLQEQLNARFRFCCGENMAQTRKSRPDSGLGFQVRILEMLWGVPSSLGSGTG